MGPFVRHPYPPREIRGYALNCATRLEANCPHFILRLLEASNLKRQVFFALAAEIDVFVPAAFLKRLAIQAPDIAAEVAGLEPLGQIGRALILLKPKQTLQVLYGRCPDGLIGLFDRLGPDPVYGAETYRLAFELFNQQENRRRAKVLGQLEGQVRAEHITVVAGLPDILLHRAVVERTSPDEVRALHTFVTMIEKLCDATPQAIRESLDALPVNSVGVNMGEWAQNWLARQIRLPIEAPIPADDPDLHLRIGAELPALGRRLRNCAAQMMPYPFIGDRLIYEWSQDGESAVLDLLRLTAGGEARWICDDVLAPSNRRVKPHVAEAIREKLDQYGILYRPLMLSPSIDKPLHDLIDFYQRPAFDTHFVPGLDGGQIELDRMLDELDRDVNGREAA